MRTWILLGAAALFLVSGCRGQAIDDRAQSEIASVHEDTQSLLVQASCPDGAVLRSSCGLLSQRVAMQDFRDTFAAKKCAGDSMEVCQAKFDEAVSAWMVQRYPLADVGTVELSCDANRGRCDDPRNHELLLLTSHDQAVRDLDRRREGDAIARRDVRHAIDDAETTDAALLSVAVIGTALIPHHRHHHW